MKEGIDVRRQCRISQDSVIVHDVSPLGSSFILTRSARAKSGWIPLQALRQVCSMPHIKGLFSPGFRTRSLRWNGAAQGSLLGDAGEERAPACGTRPRAIHLQLQGQADRLRHGAAKFLESALHRSAG